MAAPRQFIDPLGSKLPALETNLLRLRATQMLLVLFYAEELKRDVLDSIKATDRLRKALGNRNGERIPQGIKKPVEKALIALVAEKAITNKEKNEIEELIDYRNAIGHQIHGLLADVASKGRVLEIVKGLTELNKIPAYRTNAVERLRHFRERINGLYRTHHYVRTANYNGLLFQSAERVFLADIKRLEAKVGGLLAARLSEIKKLNAELSLKGTGLQDKWHPAGPWSRYGDGRLTQIGIEICYRLFDTGARPWQSHICPISPWLPLVRDERRGKPWAAKGGRASI